MPKKLSLSIEERRRAIDLLIAGHTVPKATHLLWIKHHSELPKEMVRKAYFPEGGAFRISHLEGQSPEVLNNAFEIIKTAYQKMQERGAAAVTRLQSKEAQQKALQTKWSDPLTRELHADRSRRSLEKLRANPEFIRKVRAGLEKVWAQKRADPVWREEISKKLADLRNSPGFKEKAAEGIRAFYASSKSSKERKRRQKFMIAFHAKKLGRVKSNKTASKKLVNKTQSPENNLEKPINHEEKVRRLTTVSPRVLFSTLTPLEIAVFSDHFELNVDLPEDIFERSAQLDSQRWRYVLHRAVQKILTRKDE